MRDKWVLCPYYKNLRNQSIICEGIRPKTSTHVAFASMKDCQGYMGEYCCSAYNECWIAKMHNERYRDLLG